jgi:hypothetical protein
MKTLFDSLIIGIYLVSIALAGKYSLSYITFKVQKMALEKTAQGLGDLEPITQRMTGKRLNF